MSGNRLKIFVGNLPFAATSQQLQELFQQFGEVQGINIRMDSKNSPKGYCFITFTTEDAADAAIACNHEISMDGRILTVSHATPRGLEDRIESEENETVDDSWKTAPPPRRGSDKNSSAKKKGSTNSTRRSWDQWAGPTAAMGAAKSSDKS